MAKLRVSHLAFLMLLLCILAACGDPTTPTETVQSSPTLESTPTPTSTPTPNPTLDPVITQTFEGEDYTVGYPEEWDASGAGNGVVITDAMFRAMVTITVHPSGGMDLDEAFEAVALENDTLKKEGDVSEVSHNGITWKRQGYIHEDGMKGYMLVAVHGENACMILFQVRPDLYDLYETEYFEPIWQSFKFTEN